MREPWNSERLLESDESCPASTEEDDTAAEDREETEDSESAALRELLAPNRAVYCALTELRVPLRILDSPLRLLRSLERFARAMLSNELREASVSTKELWRVVSELLTELAVAEFELLEPFRSVIWLPASDSELLSVAAHSLLGSK